MKITKRYIYQIQIDYKFRIRFFKKKKSIVDKKSKTSQSFSLDRVKIFQPIPRCNNVPRGVLPPPNFYYSIRFPSVEILYSRPWSLFVKLSRRSTWICVRFRSEISIKVSWVWAQETGKWKMGHADEARFEGIFSLFLESKNRSRWIMTFLFFNWNARRAVSFVVVRSKVHFSCFDILCTRIFEFWLLR